MLFVKRGSVHTDRIYFLSLFPDLYLEKTASQAPPPILAARNTGLRFAYFALNYFDAAIPCLSCPYYG